MQRTMSGVAMLHHAEVLEVLTRGRKTLEITGDIEQIVARSGIREGLCNVFVHHTSASVILCENADPAVRDDLEGYAARLVRDGDRHFSHTAEGPDDMAAHIRTVLTQSSLSIPVSRGRCDLGTWQGVFLWEHRARGHHRRVTVTVQGEGQAP
jgi:secondary thiamine-phosphate synthase enzyme